MSSVTQIGVEDDIATRRFGCKSSGKAFYSELDIVGGDILTDKPVKVKCNLMMESANETFPTILSMYTITGKIELNGLHYHTFLAIVFAPFQSSRNDGYGHGSCINDTAGE